MCLQPRCVPAGYSACKQPSRTLSRTGSRAVCQSLQTTMVSVPGEKGSEVIAVKAALLNSLKRCWLSM